jgi:hypothetical protein
MMKQLIRLKGCIVSDAFRTYDYEVVESAGESGEARQFHVQVSLELFRSTPLKYQDCPLLTRERLEEQLDQETPDSLARSSLHVTQPDIVSYMERHYPPKARNWNSFRALKEHP